MALIRDGQVKKVRSASIRFSARETPAEARLLMGTRCLASGDFPAAVKQLAGAIELNPSLPGLQGLYGQALLNNREIPMPRRMRFKRSWCPTRITSRPTFTYAQILLARAKVERCGSPGCSVRCKYVRTRSKANLEMADLNVGEGKLQKAAENLKPWRRNGPRIVGGASRAVRGLRGNCI